MFLSLFLTFLFLQTTFSDLGSDRAALLSLRAAVGGRTMLWNVSEPTPCNWAGVQCGNNSVIALRLPANALFGEIPGGTLGNLSGLRTLSLRYNALSGGLPTDLSACSELRNLYLQENRFSGELPGFLSLMPSLVRVNLAGNDFSGEIPTGFRNLTRLRTLYLENNEFSGSIPDFKLPNLVQFNVSGNNLTGAVPVSLKSMPTTSFLGNSLCGKPLAVCATKVSPSEAGIVIGPSIGGNGKKKKRLSGGAIAGIVIGSIVGLSLVIVLLLSVFRKRKRLEKSSSIDVAAINKQIFGQKPVLEGDMVAAAAAVPTMSGGSGKKLLFFGNVGKEFDLEELLRASAEVLGKGMFGTAYKAVLESGMVVVVKRLKDVVMSEMEFRERIERVGAMDHENLVPLRAYYFSREEKLLVYDYMPTGSLSAALHGNRGFSKTPLNWEIRSGIALGAARGIEFLHSHGPEVSHGNIKSSNILLTKTYEARVSDFGLAPLVGPSSTPNRVAGYRAPEVTDPRKVSQKADVYSFGILLLELLTGKAPTHALLNEEGVDLPRWVQSIVKEEWTSEVFDIELLRYDNAEREMVQLLQLGLDCTAQYPDNRPSMSEVTVRIEELRNSQSSWVPDFDLVDESN